MEQGLALPVTILVILAVILGSVTLATRTTLGNLGTALRGESREAHQAAEAGLAVVISTLNQESNRRLLVSNVPLNSWAANNSLLQNPCLASGNVVTNPTAAAINLRNNATFNVGGDASRQLQLQSITVKNADRSRREFQVVPKCCKLSFGSGQPLHGNDSRSCDRSFPRLLVGINGGGTTAFGVAQLRVQDAPSSTKPNEILSA